MAIAKNKTIILFVLSILGVMYLGALSDIKTSQSSISTNIAQSDLSLYEKNTSI